MHILQLTWQFIPLSENIGILHGICKRETMRNSWFSKLFQKLYSSVFINFRDTNLSYNFSVKVAVNVENRLTGCGWSHVWPL